ncbi:MAG: hypothetical protein PHE02_01905 [Lachnospiraceae bacterium]|nr:hypothetical protein [Lachnospiraceae bacterium]
METYLSTALDVTDGVNPRYDSNVKHLLSDKQILARILKYAVEEFMDMSIESILPCIGNKIEVDEVGVDPGYSNITRVEGIETEDIIPNEGKTIFDIRFSANRFNQEYKILINVEAQKSTNPQKLGYHLGNRIIYYLSRMISAQKQREFIKSEYDNLKKVKSIWICMDSADDEDSIEEIYLDKRTIYGKPPKTECPDLLRGIIIRLRNNENVKESKNQLISMLEELLSTESSEVKKKRLSEKYNLMMTEEFERRLDTMCNLSAVIEEKSREEGMDLLAKLIRLLQEDGRNDEITKVVSDSEERKKEFIKYGLID